MEEERSKEEGAAMGGETAACFTTDGMFSPGFDRSARGSPLGRFVDISWTETGSQDSGDLSNY